MTKFHKLFSISLATILLIGCGGESSRTKSSANSSSQQTQSSNDSNNSNNNQQNSSNLTLNYLKFIKKTGQTKSYNGKGEVVTDGSIKDDGYYQSGVTPTYDRDDKKNIVQDKVTKLQWEDSDHVQSAELSYKDAKNYCSNLSSNQNWHIPTIKELMSIVDFTKRAPTLDTTFINAIYGTDDVGYWSNTARGFGWIMWLNFFSGKIHWYETNSNKHFVRCVSGNSSAWAEANFDTSNTTATDNNSKLEWQDSYSGSIPQLKWEEAISYCENLTLNGKSDWRLPNINELFSITEHSHGSPTINESFKNTKEDFYWSSTTYSGSSSYAWVVSFEYGTNTYYPKSRKYSIRCVRGGR